MTSTLGFALLGLLVRGPRTGYELSRALTRPISLFWHARHSQVYPELARLRDDGLVSYEVIDGPGPRDTKRYEATAAGRDALRHWLAEPAEPETGRDQFLLKVWSVHLLDRDAAAAMVEARRDGHARQLATYRATAAAMEEESAAPRSTIPRRRRSGSTRCSSAASGSRRWRSRGASGCWYGCGAPPCPARMALGLAGRGAD